MSRAVTDSGKEVKFDIVNKPEISNLITIYTHCSSLSIAEIEAKYEGQGYGTFKKDLAEQIVATLEPIQTKYHVIRASGEITNILRQGAEEAREIANPILREAKNKMGFLLP